MRNIGEQLKRLRVIRNMTQIQLAEEIQVDRSLISKIESGETRGSIDTLQRIAQALGVTVNDLLEEQKAC